VVLGGAAFSDKRGIPVKGSPQVGRMRYSQLETYTERQNIVFFELPTLRGTSPIRKSPPP